RGVSLSKDMVPQLLEVPRRPALGVRDDHRLVDEDRDTERMEVSGADVEVAVDLLLNDRRRVVIASEELTGIRDPPVRFADLDEVSFLLKMILDRGKPMPELSRGQEADAFRQERLRGVDEPHRGERRPREVIKEDPVVSEVRHRSVAQVDDEIHRHLRDVARTERRVGRDEAHDAGLCFDLLSELHGFRPQADRELQADRLRVPAANHVEEPVRFAHGFGRQTHASRKRCPYFEGFFCFSRSISIRHGVGSFTPPLRSASFASSTCSSVVEIVKIFTPGCTRAAVPTAPPKAARIPSEMRSAPAPVAILFSRSTLCGYTRSLRWYAFPAFF